MFVVWGGGGGRGLQGNVGLIINYMCLNVQTELQVLPPPFRLHYQDTPFLQTLRLELQVPTHLSPHFQLWTSIYKEET